MNLGVKLLTQKDKKQNKKRTILDSTKLVNKVAHKIGSL